MKILFYVEPHGVRDQFSSHSMPLDYFRRMSAEIYNSDDDLHQDVETRIFCNHILADLRFKDIYAEWPFFLQPNEDEREFIEDSARMWVHEGMNDWIALMRDPGSPLVERYLAMLRRIKLEEFDYDIIVSWGENAAVRRAGEELGVGLVYLELASMRAPFPRAVLMDPVGVNGSASSSQMDIVAIEDAVTALGDELIPTLLNSELVQGKQGSAVFHSRFQAISRELAAFIAAGPRVALIPLQLADDANQLIYSPYKSVDDFVAAAVDPLLAAGWNVVVKAHPSALQRGGYVMNAQRRCLRRYAENENVFLIEADAPSSEYLPLLDVVDLVVTNNSSVAFEAMLLGRRATTLGSACYAPLGGLPPLDQAIASATDPALDAIWARRRRAIVTYMLGCAFSLDRRLGAEVVRRARLWFGPNAVPIGTPEWIALNMSELGWGTWYQKDFLRHITRADGRGPTAVSASAPTHVSARRARRRRSGGAA